MTEEAKGGDDKTIQDELRFLRGEIDDCRRKCDALKSFISLGKSVAASVIGVAAVGGLLCVLSVKPEQLIFASVFLLLAAVLLLMWLWKPADDTMDLEVIQLQRIKASVGVLALATLLGIATMLTLRFAPSGGNGSASQPTATQSKDVSSTAASSPSPTGSAQGKPGVP